MPARQSVGRIDDTDKVGLLKERVYVAFTGLAIVLALYTGSEHHLSPAQVFGTLVLGVVGVTMAAFASDIIAHLAVHRHFPGRRGLVAIVRGTLGALGSLTIPALLIALAGLDIIALHTAMLAAAGIYIAELALVVWLSVHKAELTWKQRTLAILILVGIGLLVLSVQILAHA